MIFKKQSLFVALTIVTAFGINSIAVADAKTSHSSNHHSRSHQTNSKDKAVGSGKASIYSDHFNGKKTATGERFHQNKLTAASPTLPLGSKVKVTSKKTGKSVVVKVNDRQAKGGGRVLDLSKSAAHSIGVSDGVTPVTTKVIGK